MIRRWRLHTFTQMIERFNCQYDWSRMRILRQNPRSCANELSSSLYNSEINKNRRIIITCGFFRQTSRMLDAILILNSIGSSALNPLMMASTLWNYKKMSTTRTWNNQFIETKNTYRGNVLSWWVHNLTRSLNPIDFILETWVKGTKTLNKSKKMKNHGEEEEVILP